MEYPEVNRELCTGCGICIVVCPMETIIMTGGTAGIQTSKCQNCRICVSVCEVQAIA